MESSIISKQKIKTARSKKLSEEEKRELWQLYAKNKSKKTRDKIILQYIYLTGYVVNRISSSIPPSIAVDDIESYAFEGLIDAVEKFELSKNVKFETYAVIRVRGKILDKIRSLDWIPRSTRQKFKIIQKSISELQQKLQRSPSVDEISEHSGIEKTKLKKLIANMENARVISVYDRRGDSSEAPEIIDTIKDTNHTCFLENLEKKDVKHDLSRALRRLPERERTLLTLYYHQNMTLKEIGGILSVSESRVCQLHSQAIMKLRSLLSSNKMTMKK